MKTMYRTDARVLRRRGHSLRQLSERFDISKSTASLWTKDVELSPLGVHRVDTAKKVHRERGYAILRERKVERLAKADKAAEDFLKVVSEDKKNHILALSMMYWCEGIKQDTSVSFTNSDPQLLRAFVRMLEEIFFVDRSRVGITVHIHDYHDEQEIFKRDGYKGCVRLTYGSAHIARVLIAFAKKFMNLYI
jgi:hypothetical protein